VPERNQRPDFLPLLVLLGIVIAISLGIWLFPYLQSMIQREDCVAAGWNNCG
jgi:hypothetical protein